MDFCWAPNAHVPDDCAIITRKRRLRRLSSNRLGELPSASRLCYINCICSINRKYSIITTSLAVNPPGNLNVWWNGTMAAVSEYPPRSDRLKGSPTIEEGSITDRGLEIRPVAESALRILKVVGIWSPSAHMSCQYDEEGIWGIWMSVLAWPDDLTLVTGGW